MKLSAVEFLEENEEKCWEEYLEFTVLHCSTALCSLTGTSLLICDLICTVSTAFSSASSHSVCFKTQFLQSGRKLGAESPFQNLQSSSLLPPLLPGRALAGSPVSWGGSVGEALHT